MEGQLTCLQYFYPLSSFILFRLCLWVLLFELMRVPLRENKSILFSSLVLSTQISTAVKRAALSCGLLSRREELLCLVRSQIEHPETLMSVAITGNASDSSLVQCPEADTAGPVLSCSLQNSLTGEPLRGCMFRA